MHFLPQASTPTWYICYSWWACIDVVFTWSPQFALELTCVLYGFGQVSSDMIVWCSVLPLLKVLWALPAPSSPWPLTLTATDLSPSPQFCLLQNAVCWNHAVCSLFRFTSFTSNLHWSFLHVFPWLDSWFFSSVELYFLVWMGQSLFIHSPTEVAFKFLQLWIAVVNINFCADINFQSEVK